jgi:hypothetical protein
MFSDISYPAEYKHHLPGDHTNLEEEPLVSVET